MFKGDYDALVNSDQLEITRAAIYNYLVYVLRVPVTSDIVLRKGLCEQVSERPVTFDSSSLAGSVIAGMKIAATTLGDAIRTDQAVETLTSSGVGAIDGLEVTSVDVEGRTYSVPEQSSSEGTKIGLIVGLVVGIVAGIAAIAATTFGVHKHYTNKQKRSLLNNSDEEASISMNEPAQSTPSSNNGPPAAQSSSANPAQQGPPSESRAPSAALSLTGLNFQDPSAAVMPPVKQT